MDCTTFRRPAKEQPGTLLEQLAAINRYQRLPVYFRRVDPEGAWHVARWLTIRHVRLYDEDQD